MAALRSSAKAEKWRGLREEMGEVGEVTGARLDFGGGSDAADAGVRPKMAQAAPFSGARRPPGGKGLARQLVRLTCGVQWCISFYF